LAVDFLSEAPFILAAPRIVQASTRISGRVSRHARVCVRPLSTRVTDVSLVDSTEPPALSLPGAVRTVDGRVGRRSIRFPGRSTACTVLLFSFTGPDGYLLTHALMGSVEWTGVVVRRATTSVCVGRPKPSSRKARQYLQVLTRPGTFPHRVGRPVRPAPACGIRYVVSQAAGPIA